MKQNIRLLIAVFIYSMLLISCQKSAKYENAFMYSFEDFGTEIKLNAETIEFDEPIMKPRLFVLSDSIVLVQNLGTEYLLYAYNINAKEKTGEYISFGNGPEELLRIKDMQLVGSDLYITDNQKKYIYTYNIKDFHGSGAVASKHKVSIDEFFNSLAYIENGYVATTMNPFNKRLVFFDSNGEIDHTSGEYPYYGEELSDIEKMGSFTSSMVVSQNHQRIYLFGMETDLIEMYNIKGELIKILHGPERFFPHLKEVSQEDGFSSVISSEGESRDAFFNPVIIGDEIYVSYSGNYRGREEITPIMNILVFDIDCNPVRRYELSKPIVMFAVDPQTKHIYATCNVPDYHMVVFKP